MSIGEDKVDYHDGTNGVLKNRLSLKGIHTKHNSNNQTNTVIIVGAGPVGTFLAYRLAKEGINVTVIEKESQTSEAPRAVGYYAASMQALVDAGLYDKIREEGFMVRGLAWRKQPVGDGEGGKQLGEEIAVMPLAAPDDDLMEPPAGLLCLQQALLTKLFLREALATGKVTILFNRELTGIEDHGGNVTATTKGTDTKVSSQMTASFLVATDGGRSTSRKLLGISFPGHTWPERLLATDVTIKNENVPTYACYYQFHKLHYGLATPLTEPLDGKESLWRYAVALDPNENRSDEELLSDEHIESLYEDVMVGPRPLKVRIGRRAIYKIHQRLATTLRRGRSLLAGDAAHVCNPFGALGLNSGLLDADALSDALIMILNESKPLSVLDLYSDERRKVFQYFVDPTSTHNKLRVQFNSQETAATDDDFFRLLREGSMVDRMEATKMYYDTWRTNIRKLAKAKGY
ncbi:uncharacterized protein A1O9_02183 [Exophiala aquamarina CBS 119918]|uniref:FAD-binding domain-containing protein n=1 Tax=Exophiala aquamarina CBS 119918 TaxID=1182545 RepID=A0A072PLJ1_9EURO|nr:uncharacterized protein A1O9_02183 [Exophiala aquamarina CBS 119918]KEF60622.1 hypothetical protein A1O9_02183 [Exophiala aquamarina CBS 119918]